MRKSRVEMTVHKSANASWTGSHSYTINRNKGIDLLPKNMHHSFLKRFMEWWK